VDATHEREQQADVNSATACGEYAGTRVTAMLSRSASFRSTWLRPAQRSSTTRVPPACSARSTGADMSSLTTTQTACAPAASVAVSCASRGSKQTTLCSLFAASKERRSWG
jgi:hypothetical protein